MIEVPQVTPQLLEESKGSDETVWSKELHPSVICELNTQSLSLFQKLNIFVAHSEKGRLPRPLGVSYADVLLPLKASYVSFMILLRCGSISNTTWTQLKQVDKDGLVRRSAQMRRYKYPPITQVFLSLFNSCLAFACTQSALNGTRY